MVLSTSLALTEVAAHTVAFTAIVKAVVVVVAKTVPFGRAVTVFRTVPFSKAIAVALLVAASLEGTEVATDCYPRVAKTFK